MHLASNKPLRKQQIPEKTNLDGQKLKAAQDDIAEVGLR